MFQTTNQITSQPFKHMIAHESLRSQALDYLLKMPDPSNLVVRLGLYFAQDSYKINKMGRFRHPAANKYNYFIFVHTVVFRYWLKLTHAVMDWFRNQTGPESCALPPLLLIWVEIFHD
jgi:hypothetical protein